MVGKSKVLNKFYLAVSNEKTYPSISLLRYKYGFVQKELEFLDELKLDDVLFNKLPLKDDKGRCLVYYLNDIIGHNFLISIDFILSSKIEELNQIENEDIINGFIFSEIESSLRIEGIRSTRKKIAKINASSYENLVDQNEVIVKNMLMGYQFIQTKEITIDNIYSLYNILSKNCLKKEEQLLVGNYYRHDEVSIVGGNEIIIDKGVDYSKLEELMNELVKYIGLPKSEFEHILTPHIIHYYLVYLHPYFDYNGRLARVLSFWYSLNKLSSVSLLFTSESINNIRNRKYYYQAIKNSRQTKNDITYFLEYMGDITLKQTINYINLYTIINRLESQGYRVSSALHNAIKVVLLIPKENQGYFSWKKYKLYEFEDFNKQYILRLLNKLVDFKVLSVKTHKNSYLYKLNQKYIIHK
jgi:Fic family protein